MTRPDSAYLDFLPYEGGEGEDVRRRRVRIVTVRKAQTCVIPTRDVHEIKPGSRARVEKAIVHGRWASFYVCLECMELALAQLEEHLEG